MSIIDDTWVTRHESQRNQACEAVRAVHATTIVRGLSCCLCHCKLAVLFLQQAGKLTAPTCDFEACMEARPEMRLGQLAARHCAGTNAAEGSGLLSGGLRVGRGRPRPVDVRMTLQLSGGLLQCGLWVIRRSGMLGLN